MNGNMHTNGFKRNPARCFLPAPQDGWILEMDGGQEVLSGDQLEVAVSAKPPLQYGKNPVTELPEGAPELPEW